MSLQTREELLECRKTLLDNASAIVLQSRVPDEAFVYLEQLPTICMRALAISEKQTGKAVEAAAAASLQALDTLEKSANFPNLFRNIKLFGSKYFPSCCRYI